MPFFKIGDDKTIKQWNMEAPGYGEEEEPINTILGKVCFFFFFQFFFSTKAVHQNVFPKSCNLNQDFVISEKVRFKHVTLKILWTLARRETTPGSDTVTATPHSVVVAPPTVISENILRCLFHKI